MSTLTNNTRQIFVLSYISAIFFILPVYVVSEEVKANLLRFFTLLSLFLFFCFISKNKLNIKALRVTSIILIVLSFLSVINGGLVYINFTLALFLILLYLDDDIIHDISIGFINLYVLILLVSIFMFFLAHVLSIGYTAEVYHTNPLKNESGVYYQSFYRLLLVEVNEHSPGLLSYRFQSIFDEPGVVGTISGIMLIGLVKVKMKIQKTILIISGFLSISVAFFFFFIIFLIMSMNFKRFIFFGGILLFLFLSVQYYIDNPLVNIAMQKIERGNNRFDQCFSEKFEQILSDGFLFGKGLGATNSLGCDVSSFLAQVYDYGLMGFVLILLSVILVYFNVIYKKKGGGRLLFWIMLILINFYQRPHYFMPVFVVLGFCFVNFEFFNRRKCLVNSATTKVL